MTERREPSARVFVAVETFAAFALGMTLTGTVGAVVVGALAFMFWMWVTKP